MSRPDRPLRVAVIAPHFAEYATHLAVALAEHADVMLVTEQRNERAECEGLDLGDENRLSRARYRGDVALRPISFRGLLARRAIHRAIDEFAPDLLHVQEQGDIFMASLVERYAQKIPVVATVHDPKPHSGGDSLVARRFAGGLVRIRTAAHAYHVHGAYCEALLREVLGGDSPIVATAHGTILEPAHASHNDTGSTFLFFGRMEAYKGVEALLDAIDLLQGSGLSFVFAGRGPELDRCRPRIQTDPAIELIDRFLTPSEAIAQFQRARAVLVPYRDATQSGVVSAAFGNGRPVIATRVGGLVDAVADGVNGLLIPPDDPQALAAAIQKMGDPETSGRLAQGARAAARGPFAWPAIAGHLDEFYRELLDGAPRAGPRPR